MTGSDLEWEADVKRQQQRIAERRASFTHEQQMQALRHTVRRLTEYMRHLEQSPATSTLNNTREQLRNVQQVLDNWEL